MPVSLRHLAVLSVLSVGLALAAGCSAPEDVLDEEQEPDDEDGPVSSSESELGGCNQCSNCVKYARCRQPRLPYGLTSFADKVAAINSRTPRRGCVAVIRTGSVYGHVAYVNDVSGGRISIDEGNWPSGRCGRRSGTPAALNVRGYFCP
jgi:hypothetical protein